MIAVLLVLHLLVTLTLIATVLIQRSEGGGLGIGSSQGMGSFMSGRGTANLLTRTTAILAAIFMLLSLALAVLNRGGAGRGRDILALPQAAAPAAPGLGTRTPVLPSRPPVAPAPVPGRDVLAAPAAPAPGAPPAAPPVATAPVPGHDILAPPPAATPVPAAPSVPGH